MRIRTVNLSSLIRDSDRGINRKKKEVKFTVMEFSSILSYLLLVRTIDNGRKIELDGCILQFWHVLITLY